ncbi:hypothetical protein Agabi119p4_8415 [Agaricus bisporus var. burnettii]|uniref:Uncharacterized protein n=1 Tax=Agaricus bisporus var. burnettii TaxID=192524 RepID=A0A8H7C5S8_AGABI|nr:hypothetical protein Agabi119p4_8415 [Agaricus bisporus var. burnettii]
MLHLAAFPTVCFKTTSCASRYLLLWNPIRITYNRFLSSQRDDNRRRRRSAYIPLSIPRSGSSWTTKYSATSVTDFVRTLVADCCSRFEFITCVILCASRFNTVTPRYAAAGLERAADCCGSFEYMICVIICVPQAGMNAHLEFI